MIYASISDKGRQRPQNQDNYSNLIKKHYALFVVADGMGGHKAGDIASKIAVQEIRDYISQYEVIDKPYDVLEAALDKANERILSMARENVEYESMGTTVVCALIIDNVAYIVHLGDSRCYYYRNGKLRQLTKDDSYLQKLIDTGIEDIEKNMLERYKSMVTKALGAEWNLEINKTAIELEAGDYLILSTDGLTNMVDDDEIEEVIGFDLNIKEATEILVYMANASGGYDNITLTLVKV